MADVFDRFSRMVAADHEPKLNQDDLEAILAGYQKIDENGVAPGDGGWIPTYNLRAAAAEGWRWKAGRAAELQSTDLDGDRMSANQIFDHCQEMIKIYSRGTASPLTSSPPATNLVTDFFCK
jgi:hypothetical protein